jgi:hypothetical protein
VEYQQYRFSLKNGKSVLFEVREEDRVEDLKWGSSVPYVQEFLAKNRKTTSFFYGEFSMRLHCFFKIQEAVAGSYLSVMDMLGGLGCTGKIFEVVPEETFLNDLDDSCVEALRCNFVPENIFQEDAYRFPFQRKYDLVLSDFNNLTVPRTVGEYKPFLDGMFAHADRYVVITECSVFHLKYGKKSYQNYEKFLGEFEHTREGFFRAVRDWYRTLYPEWYLTRVEHFSASAYFLFQREDLPLQVRYHTREEMRAQPPILLSIPIEEEILFEENFYAK